MRQNFEVESCLDYTNKVSNLNGFSYDKAKITLSKELQAGDKVQLITKDGRSEVTLKTAVEQIQFKGYYIGTYVDIVIDFAKSMIDIVADDSLVIESIMYGLKEC